MTRDCFRSASATIRVMRWTVPVLLAALAAGCAYRNPTAPTSVVVVASAAPASIRLVGASRADRAGLDLTATVLTASGAFVPGVPVDLATSAGVLSPSAGVTDGAGVFKSVLSTGGTATVSAQAAGLTTSVTVLGTPDTTTPPPPPPPPLPPVTPTPAPLTVSVAVAGSPTAGTATTFGLSTQGLRSAIWTFGDGQALTTTSTGLATHTYAAGGTYGVGVTVTDTTGRTASTATSVTVAAAPTGSGTTTSGLGLTLGCSPPSTHSPATATPCNLSASYNGTALGSAAVTSVTWDWGEGATTTTVSPTAPASSHVYVNAGNYTVFATATVTTADGPKTATTSKSVVIP